MKKIEGYGYGVAGLVCKRHMKWQLLTEPFSVVIAHGKHCVISSGLFYLLEYRMGKLLIMNSEN
ncbi:hypothetical protein ACMXYN_07695 [Neptuniibacter sp. PT8_73]|uniref:hypothetical protein n=1 Tax=unclassified Neptuniibacter TaxID=2630693 RepID=UPI0039F44F48